MDLCHWGVITEIIEQIGLGKLITVVTCFAVLGRDRLLFCFAVVYSLCAVRYYSDYALFSIKYVSRVNFDSTYRKMK